MLDDNAKVNRRSADQKIAQILDRAKSPLNDLGNARRLKAAYEGDIIHVNGRGWAVWNGAKYNFASGENEAKKLASTLPGLVKEEADVVGKHGEALDLTERWELQHPSNLLNFAHKCGNMSMINHALEAYKTEHSISTSQLDLAPHLLTVQNGCIDLHKFSQCPGFPAQYKRETVAMHGWATAFFGEHRRENMPTRSSNVVYDPTATCPTFKAVLRDIFPDKDVLDCFQRCSGAMLYGSNRSQVMLMFRGSGGNGKSTLLNVLSRVLGDYASSFPVTVFLKTPTQDAGRASPEEANMPAARLVIASEPGMSDTLSGKDIKAFTGGDARMTRALYKSAFEYTPSAIPVMQFNRTPRIVEEDEGLRRRLVFIPFDVELHKLPSKRRKDPEKVEAALNGELSGILNWMLVGYKKYAERLAKGKGTPMGIDPPERMLELRDRLLRLADPVGEFLKESTRRTIGNRLAIKDLYEEFQKWAEANGTAAMSSVVFAKLLIEKGYETRKSNGYAKVLDLAWK